MAMPLIDPLPPAPTPADPEPVFDDKAYETVAALAPFVEQANTLAVAVEGQAERSKTEADRSQAQVNAATVEANRAKTEADRSHSEADRAQAAADDAVAVVTGGTASIEPEAGKIPIAGSDAAIKQAWIKDLEFELDALRVARNKLMYGDGPYPVLDLQFQGAKYLDPRIDFTRASVDWDQEGNIYEVNEPVLTDKGLSIAGRRRNFLLTSNVLKSGQGWRLGDGASIVSTEKLDPLGTRNAVEIAGMYGSANANSGHSLRVFINQLGDLDGPHCFSFYSEQSLGDANYSLRLYGPDKDEEVPFEQEDMGNGWFRFHSGFNASGITTIIIVSSYRDLNKSFFGFHLNSGLSPESYIPTSGSSVTVSPTNFKMDVSVNGFAPRKGSVFCDFNLDHTEDSRGLVFLSTETNKPFRLMGLTTRSGVLRFSYRTSGPESFYSRSFGRPVIGARYKAAFSWDMALGLFRVALNGEYEDVKGVVELSEEVINTLYLSGRNTPAGAMPGGVTGDTNFATYRSLVFFDGVLSESEMIKVTR